MGCGGSTHPHSTMEWAALLHDGTVLARFGDLSAMVLHESGSRFLCEAPDGKRTGQLTRFVTSQYRAKLRQVLDFRNFYWSGPALLCKEVLFEKDSGAIAHRLSAVKSARWPSFPCASASKTAKSVSFHPDGSVSVTSLDQTASLTLDVSASFFTVTYWAPVLFAEAINSLDLSHATLVGGQDRGDDDSCCHAGACPVVAGTGHPSGDHRKQADETSECRSRRSARMARGGGGIEHMRVVQCYSADARFAHELWRHPLDLAMAALASAQSRLSGDARAAGAGCSQARSDDDDQLFETQIPGILEIEASAVKSADMMMQMKYNDLLSSLSSRQGGQSFASEVEWSAAGILRYLPNGSVQLIPFCDSLVHVLSVSMSGLACRLHVLKASGKRQGASLS